MTRDLIQAYKDKFKDNKTVLDSYKLANGFYYLVKQTGEIEKLTVEKGQGDNPELYNYIKVRDFYSICLNSDKILMNSNTKKDLGFNMQKKILSSNEYTLFFNSKNIIELNSKKDEKAIPKSVFLKGIDLYYDILYKMGKEKEDREYGYFKEEIDINCKKMKEVFEKVIKELEDLKIKDMSIKIFIENTEEEYKRVSDFYINLKIFNSDKNKIKKNPNIVYGINNYNFTDNQGKPFLKLRTTTYQIASLVNTEDINMIRRIYIWLKNNTNTNIMLPEKFQFYGNGQENQEINNDNVFNIDISYDAKKARIKIEDFEFISNYSTGISKFEYKDLLNGKNEIIYSADTIYEFKRLVNDLWITHNWKKSDYSSAFKNLFQKEDKKIFLQNLDKMGTEIVENTLIEEFNQGKGYRRQSIESMNLWLCLDKYFNKKEVKYMKINNVQERCKNIVESNEKIEKDDEYYFLVGQVAYFLLSKSKASKLTQDVTEPFIKANNMNVLIEEVKFLYQRYNYEIPLKYKKFNNIYSQILMKKPDGNVKDNKDIILAGMLSENLFYMKKDGGKNDEEE